MAGQIANMNPVVEDHSASYTVVPADIRKILVATGAATFTLPPVANVTDGWNVTFFNAVDAAMTVSAPTGLLVTFNDVAANSVALSTTSEKAGGGFRIVYDATLGKYLCFIMTEETQTVTVAT